MKYTVHVEYTYKNGKKEVTDFEVSDRKVAMTVFFENHDFLKNIKEKGDIKDFKIGVYGESVEA